MTPQYKAELPVHTVRARNTSVDSENRIHDDAVASSFGFRGGLVPGVTVFGYMTVPVVSRFPQWIDQGGMHVRFLQPFYDGDEVIIRAYAAEPPTDLKVEAIRGVGTVCATATVLIDSRESRIRLNVRDHSERPLPERDSRPDASPETLAPGMMLGTLQERFDPEASEGLLEQMHERLPCYRGPDAVAHPTYLLGLSNEVFLRNFKLGPWIHASSEVTNWSALRAGETVTVRASIASCYERKGHEFAELNVLITSGNRIVQQVHHTAIYRPRAATA